MLTVRTTNKKQKLLKTNGKTHRVGLSLDLLSFPALAEVKKTNEQKIGNMPPLPKDLPRGVWTEQAQKVLEERYLFKDKEGKIVETPEGLCWRVAWEVASADALWGKNKKGGLEIAKNYYDLLSTHEFLPNSPTLMNA